MLSPTGNTLAKAGLFCKSALMSLQETPVGACLSDFELDQGQTAPFPREVWLGYGLGFRPDCSFAKSGLARLGFRVQARQLLSNSGLVRLPE